MPSHSVLRAVLKRSLVNTPAARSVFSGVRTIAKMILVIPALLGNHRDVKENLAAHEWGTFTSVAASDGTLVQWAPLSVTPDLPCFVDHLSTRNLKAAPGLVRMETPVLYLYSPQSQTVSVHIDFPEGWITEWYPQATQVKPHLSANPQRFTPFGRGQIDWDSIQISPDANPELPSAEGPSRYFAARNTDSSPLQISRQQEKFLFYRGVGNFAVPLQPRFLNDHQLELRNIGSESVPLAIVFENRKGKLGFRMVRDVQDATLIEAPELIANLDDLRGQLTAVLTEFGLYQKEALAMIETWQDSWFEEGSRIFYIVPRPIIDSVLPLTISPEPAATVRVFVGRIEVLSPWVEQTLETALAAGDIETLAKFGRFLNPFLKQLNLDHRFVESPAAREYLGRAYSKMAEEFNSEPCVR